MQQAISLVTLTEQIKHALDANLSPSYWVIAEIGELRDSVRGHAYLDLIEKSTTGMVAKIRGNIWSYTYQTIRRKFERVTGRPLQSGMSILALVNVQFHELYGISLIIKDIDANFTLGERARKRQEIIDRLTLEGLLEQNKQFVLPKVSQKIALISSVTAAGYGDFMTQLEKNAQGYRVHVRFFQASMQGNNAVPEIIEAIEQVEKNQVAEGFDLVVIIRGGGAQSDLDCFDDYTLAKTIANAALPVVTGIGHERDESIADLVAHTQLKTPTAVAAFILSGFQEYEDTLRRQMMYVERYTQKKLKDASEDLLGNVHLLKNLLQGKITEKKNTLNNVSKNSQRLSLHKVDKMHIRLANTLDYLKKNSRGNLHKSLLKIEQYEKIVRQSDPVYLLSKGYTRTEKDGVPIHKCTLETGDTIVTYSVEKKITSQIKKVDSP
ncbi:exodeoxyribonuclease VII large subunit [Cyclobacterium xiamenense]|jgi:exodeoxyribonuclease VII large subunit|uniref:exodeoxyribonuclease VII large subunit n=1 Tax=Cyclobacterium xiamenense TaxID=1297121 RepID=UPI0035D12F79